VERKLVTADCHMIPPPTLADELPAAYREWLLVNEPSAAMGVTNGDNRGDTVKTAWPNACLEAQPSYAAAEFVADLARDGVQGAVIIITEDAAGIRPGAPLDVEIAYCRLVNDWMAGQWAPYLDRFAPGILLPWHDIPSAVKELERAAGMGMRPALLPDFIWEKPYYLPEWEPVWEICSAMEIPISMHVYGHRLPAALRSAKPPGAIPGSHTIGFYKKSVEMGETLAWFVYSGIFERYPNLHVVMTEGSASWLGFAMQFFDHFTVESRSGVVRVTDSASYRRARSTTAKLDAPASFYLKRQAHATFMWDPLAIRVRDLIGLDCLLWGNDYPHNEGSFPYSNEWIDKQFMGVPEQEIDQVVRANANRIFRLNV
jgi:predicted TIM-barrel fold metal-dependent hydrolase